MALLHGGLAQRMRDAKKIKELASGPVVAEHTLKQIDRAADLRARKQPKVKKRGQHKCWLPTASLRCCFGHVVRRGGQRGSRRVTYLAMSGHSVSDVFEGGHAHIQNTMDAGALAVWRLQQERMRSLPFAQLCIIKITFDETETVVSMRGSGQSVRSLFMLHGEVRSFERMDGPGVRHQLMLPPAVLSNTKTECFWNAIMSRLPDTLADIKRRCKCMAIVIGSDSAKSCIKLGKVFKGRTALTAGLDGCVSVWAPCLMHMAALCVFFAMKVHGVLVPLFCACVLMRQSKVFPAFVVRAELQIEKMEIVFEEPDGVEVTHRYLVSLFAFLEQTRSTALDEDAGPHVRSRRQAAARLSTSLSASLVENGKITKLRHYCTYGCCSSEAEAVEKVKADFKLVLFGVPPDVPACNRWAKVYPPLCYWMVLMAFPFTDPALHEVAQVKCDLSEAAVFNDADEVGLGEEDTWHKRFRARFRRVLLWVRTETMQRTLAVLTTALRNMIDLFGVFFSEAKFSSEGRHSAFAFCCPSKSPAVRCLGRYFNDMADMGASCWRPVAGAGGWGPKSLYEAGTTNIILVCNLWQRAVRPFDVWPWRLGVIVDEAAPEARKMEVARQLFALRECCVECGIALHVRRVARTEERLLASEEIKAMIREILKAAPSNNIQNEDRFARRRNHAVSARGHAYDGASIASRHSLSEATAWHSRAHDQCWSQLVKDMERARAAAQAARAGEEGDKYLSGWNAFVAANARSEGHQAVRGLRQRWNGLTAAEKAEWSNKRKAPSVNEAEPDLQRLREMVQRLTPWSMGSEDQALSEEEAAPFFNCIKARSREWRQLFGSEVRPTEQPLHVDNDVQCCQAFGFGVCKMDLTADEKKKFQSNLAICHALCQFGGMASEPGEIKNLPLFHLVHADDPERSVLALLGATLRKPFAQAYLKCERAPGAVGDIIDEDLSVSLGVAAFRSEVDVAMFMLQTGGRLAIKLISYEFTTLRALSVRGVVDITEAVAACVSSVASDYDYIVNMTKMLKQKQFTSSKPKKPSKGGGGGSAAKPAKGAPPKAGEAGGDDESSGSEGEILPPEVDDVPSFVAYWEVKGEVADAPPEVPEGGLEGGAEEDGLPKVVDVGLKDTIEFHDPAGTEVYGRQSILHPGEPKESISFYCRLHSHKMCVTSA
ncbi:unnamed protein product, partial [Prorocentrum cordatum]